MILNRMNTEGNIMLTVEEIATSTLKVENNECDITDKQVSQKTQNTVVLPLHMFGIVANDRAFAEAGWVTPV